MSDNEDDDEEGDIKKLADLQAGSKDQTDLYMMNPFEFIRQQHEGHNSKLKLVPEEPASAEDEVEKNPFEIEEDDQKSDSGSNFFDNLQEEESEHLEVLIDNDKKRISESEEEPEKIQESFYSQSSQQLDNLSKSSEYKQSVSGQSASEESKKSKRPAKGAKLSYQDMLVRLNKGGSSMSQASIKRTTYDGRIVDPTQYVN